ncbi:Fimbrial protein [Cupriavidus sp. YR651]|uniref:fimbrial protein n=1 Tax=Cupriavidus sp. YR651 TaxID=1855315 RepID=UPI00088F3766|nr:fimbrial protein [Cupriavidus sp. YR651]SDD37912.1 Fimbrial protein [Cupriavidus sp. YR651]
MQLSTGSLEKNMPAQAKGGKPPGEGVSGVATAALRSFRSSRPEAVWSLAHRYILAALLSVGAIAALPGNAVAACTGEGHDPTQMASAMFSESISVPRDAAVGQVIGKRDFPVITTRGPFGVCFGGGTLFYEGLQALVPGFADVYESGIPGLGLRFTIIERGPQNGVVPARIPISGTIQLVWESDEKIRVELIKTAATIGTGGTIAPREYVRIRLDSGPDRLNFVFGLGPLVVNTLTCRTASFTVDLGAHRSSELKGQGSFTSAKDFSIALDNCPAGITSIQYRLDPATTTLDAANAVVALDSASTANGIGVQLLDNAGNALALGNAISFAGITTGGGAFRIPLKARYYQTGGVVTAGTANTSMTFTLTYQ